MKRQPSKQIGVMVGIIVALIAGTALLANYMNAEPTGTCPLSQMSACAVSANSCSAQTDAKTCSNSDCCGKQKCNETDDECCGKCDKASCADKTDCPLTNTETKCESQAVACCGGVDSNDN